MKKISVILPCYNEEKRIAGTLREAAAFAKKHKNYEFLFVNDGSRDGTLEVLKSEQEKAKNKNLRVVSYPQNRGKGHAVRFGVENSDGEYICFIDSDLAYSLEHLIKMADALQKFDVVIGVRGLSKEGAENVPLARKVFGIGFNILSRIILGLKFRDMQAGLKGFRKEAAKNLFEMQTMEGFSFDTEIIFLAKKYGYKIGEIPAVVSNGDTYKTSKVKLFRDSAKMLLNLIKIRLNDLTGKYG